VLRATYTKHDLRLMNGLMTVYAPLVAPTASRAEALTLDRAQAASQFHQTDEDPKQRHLSDLRHSR